MRRNLPDTTFQRRGDANLIETGDCRDGMTGIASRTVALTLTDPPYFLDGMDNRWNNEKLRQRITPGIIGGLPRGQKFSTLQGKNLHRFLRQAASEVHRVMFPGGFVLAFAAPRLAHRTAAAFEDGGFQIRDLLFWKRRSQPKAFSQNHFVRRRNISEKKKQQIIARLGGRKTAQLRPDAEVIVLAQKPPEGTLVDNFLTYGVGLADMKNPMLGNGFPGTLIEAARPAKRSHLTEKPVNLGRHLIRIFAGEKGGLVLDPFAGSGAFGEAALLEGYRFRGFETDRETAAAANLRLKNMLESCG